MPYLPPSNRPGRIPDRVFNIEIQNKKADAPLTSPKPAGSPLPSSFAPDALNWTDPDLLISAFEDRLRQPMYVGPDWSHLTKWLECLRSFRKRVAKASGRFRHPSCRAAHSILTMGGYDRVNSMSCCGTYKGSENPSVKSTKGWCQRRRFCASCAWWASREVVSKFLRQVPKHKGQIHAFHLSWTFPLQHLGIVGPTDGGGDAQDLAGLINAVWNLGETAFRRVVKYSGGMFRGGVMVESLTATHLMPLAFNPHFHGLICCEERQLDTFVEAMELAIPLTEGFEEVGRWVDRASVQVDSIGSNADFVRFLTYAFAAFGLGRPGSCIDDVYEAAWNRCRSQADLRELNREVAFWVQAFDYACFDRRRTVMTGVFWHRHHQTLRSAPTADNRDFVSQIYARLEEEEIIDGLCDS